MAGLNPEMAPAPPEDPAMAPPADDLGGEESVTPEEQQLYDKFVGKAMTMIYDPKMFQTIIETLGTEGDAKEALANTAVFVVTRVVQAAQEKGADITGDVLLHGGTEIFDQLAEIATKANIYNFDEDVDAKEGAYFLALDKYRLQQEEAGGVDKEAMNADLAQIQSEDQTGKLGQDLQGLAMQGEEEAESEAVHADPSELPAEEEPVEDMPEPPKKGLGAAKKEPV